MPSLPLHCEILMSHFQDVWGLFPLVFLSCCCPSCHATGDGERHGSWAEWCGCFAEVTGGLEASLLEHPLQNADSACAP